MSTNLSLYETKVVPYLLVKKRKEYYTQKQITIELTDLQSFHILENWYVLLLFSIADT